ncbi:hypothetical protein CW358_03720 [Pseudomonas protegens]|nr:hypothetical protein CW358_03720 [Pseudomonas protegens]
MVLHYNRYNQDGYRNYVDDYEQPRQDFCTQQNMSPKTWKEAIHNSMTCMEYMGSRKDLREMVEEKGFKFL